MPPNTKKVDRSSRWGNPFRVGHPMSEDGHPIPEYLDWPGAKRMTSADAVRCFRVYVEEQIRKDPEWLIPLRGKNLACWCKPGDVCHADVLLQLAND